MKKYFILLIAAMMVAGMQAQTYRIVSRSNDTIRLHSNKLGEALKSVVPGGATTTGNYRLIEKIENGTKSLIFVDFTQLLDKIFVTYETDLIHAGDWQVQVYSFDHIYYSAKRENAILLKGQLLGMDIEIYQRPEPYKDIINIDGIEFGSPIKIQVYESKIAQDLQNKKNEQVAEWASVGLREEDITKMSGKANECYIAYLLISGRFDNSADRTLMNDLCNKEEAMSLRNTYNEEQLKYLSKGHDNRLNKYAKK